MPKNYYVILGLNTAASPQQIKEAYRRLAKELHPDHSGRESGPFRDVQEAYSVLSDPSRRQLYDRDSSDRPLRFPTKSFRGTDFFSRGGIEPLIHEKSIRPVAGDFQPSFEELLSRLSFNFDQSIRPKSGQSESLMLEVLLNPEEAQQGGRFWLEIPVRVNCAVCRGCGNLGWFECWSCAGRVSGRWNIPSN